MSVSPADFELYSRVTGTPLPRNAAERMRLAPQVYNFTRNFAREPTFLEKTASAFGKAAIAGGSLAALYGLSRLGTEGTVTSTATPDPTPPTPSAPDQGEWRPPLGTRSMQNPPVPEEKVRLVRNPVYTKQNYGNVPSTTPVESSTLEDPWGSGQNEVLNQTNVVEDARSQELAQQSQESATIPEAETTSALTVRDQADDLVNVVENTPGQIQQVGTSPIETLQSIGNVWSTRGGGRLAPAPRGQVDESEYTERPNFSTVKTAPTLVNPTGRRTIANPQIIGTDREGNPITSTPKATFTQKDLQFPFPNRTNPGMAFIAASTDAPTTGIPLVDEISVPVISNLTGWHLPGAAQVVTTAGPYIAGLGRQAAGDVVDTARFAGSGINYVAKNLRPILEQGREDWAKGGRDWQTGVQDLGLVRETGQRLMLAAGQKRDADLSRISGAAQAVGQLAERVETWAEAARLAGGQKALPGSEERLNNAIQQADLGSESPLGDLPQGPDPEQVVSDESQVPPSRRINQRKEELLSTYAKSLANLSPESREELANRQIEQEQSGIGERVKNFVDKTAMRDPFLSGLFGGDGAAFIQETDDRTPQGPATYLLPDKQNGSPTRGIKGVGYDEETGNLTTYMKVSRGREEVEGTGVRGYETPGVTREEGEQLTRGAEASFDEPEEKRSKYRSSLRAAMQRKADTQDK